MLDRSETETPHESGEYEPDSPESAEFDPDSLGPDRPTPPEPPDSSDADPAVRGLFWWLVLLANVALVAASLGVMFVVFQGRWAFGTQLTLAGLIVGGYVYYRIRRFQPE